MLCGFVGLGVVVLGVLMVGGGLAADRRCAGSVLVIGCSL